MELGGFATPLPRGVQKRKRVATVNQFEETDPQKITDGSQEALNSPHTGCEGTQGIQKSPGGSREALNDPRTGC